MAGVRDGFDVLTIAKMGIGQEEYYLGKVAGGLEDYYSGAGEVHGQWIGRGAERLALSGDVDGAQLRALMEGLTPDRSARLAGRPGRTRTPGWDLTFSAPKSVSVLYGLGGLTVAEQVVAAHETAVADALGWLEDHATVSRRRIGGQITTVAGEGLVVAAFRHRTSRLGDPQLHTHALATNVVERTDGSWGALDSRPIYRHALTASRLYQAVLRSELTGRLGVEWGRVDRGIAEISGIDPALRRQFSKRREQIEAAMDAAGETSARAAQVAAHQTRPTKEHAETTENLYARWEHEARTHGFDPDQVTAVTGHRMEQPTVTDTVVARIVEDLVDPVGGLVARDSNFDRATVARAWCEGLPAGTRIDRNMVEDLIDRAVADARTVAIDPGSADGPVMVGADGTTVAVGVRGDARWSTVELLAVERRMLTHAAAGQNRAAGQVDATVAGELLAQRADLGADQADMVRHLVTSGNSVDVVVGRAGTGKTYALAAAVEVWRNAGYQPVGAALAARAAAELEAGTGMRSSTIAQLFVDLDRSPEPQITARHVLVVDEAAMVDTRRLAALISLGRNTGAKIVLVGDHHQLPAVETGGGFAALVEALDPIEVTINRRQRHVWEQDTLARLRDGATGMARVISDYQEHDRIRTSPNPAEARATMALDWHQHHQSGASVAMVALRREDVTELNTRARTLLAAAGTINPGEVVEAGDRSFAVGERVVCLRNDRRVGVHNALSGTVTAIDPDNPAAAIVFVDDIGHEHDIPRSYLADGNLDWGYAMTVHKAQGATVDRCLVLGDDRLYRQAGYTALSRGRISNDLYLIGDDDRDLLPELELDRHGHAVADDPIDRAIRALGRDGAKELAVAIADRHPRAAGAGRGDSLAELWARRDDRCRQIGTRPLSPAAGLDGAVVASRRNLDRDQQVVDQLVGEQKRWWQRRDHTPRRRLNVAQERLGQATVAYSNATVALNAADDQTRECDEWSLSNAAGLAEVAELDETIEWRTTQAGHAAEHTRPSHVVDVIGPPPVGDRTAWRDAAGAIESYQARWQQPIHHTNESGPIHAEQAEHLDVVLGAIDAVQSPMRPVVEPSEPTMTL